MLLAGTHAEAAGVFYTMISGDRQDLKGKLARVQDNAEELLALIKEHVTEEQAMRYGFIANIVKALEMKGYGGRIRLRKLWRIAQGKYKRLDLGSLPYYEILERRAWWLTRQGPDQKPLSGRETSLFLLPWSIPIFPVKCKRYELTGALLPAERVYRNLWSGRRTRFRFFDC